MRLPAANSIRSLRGQSWPQYGSARDHVVSLQVVLADGRVMEASRHAVTTEEPERTPSPENGEGKLAAAFTVVRLGANAAAARMPDYMLLSWHDRDRDFEAPQHVSECHAHGAVPGYVDYGIHHGATLKVDVEDGRFVFFYRPVEL